jgi:hypothetical protein
VGTLQTFTVSGIVKDPSNNGVANVTLKDSNNNQLAITAADGTYSFTKPFGWSSTVTPYGDNNQYNFSPVNRTYSNLSSNQTNQDYIAILKVFTVSGTFLDNNNNPLPAWAQAKVNGVAVNPTTGAYSFTVNYGDSLTLNPQAIGYNIAPPSATFTNITSNQTQNFVGTIQTFTVSGTFLDNNGNVLPTWADAKVNNVTVSSTGAYSFTVNYNDNLTLTPTATGYNIAPTTKTFTNITANQTQNFVGTIMKFTVSGTVSGLSVPDNITITAQGTGSYAGQNFPATVGTNGSYSTGQVVPYNWTGSLVVSSAAYNLTAEVPIFNGGPVTSDVTQNYTAAIKTFTVSGNITGILPTNPYPITVTATTTNNPTYGVYQSYPNIVATNGTYSISVPYGWQGNITASSVAYNLTPASITVAAVTANLSGQDFAATLKTFTVSGTVTGLLTNNPYPVDSNAN